MVQDFIDEVTPIFVHFMIAAKESSIPFLIMNRPFLHIPQV